MKKRILVVGGVAGGASCAARARRLSEDAEIIIFERGSFVSFANCGLPYHVGNVIKKEQDLLVASPERFRDYFNIDVRTDHNVRLIDRENKQIEVENLITGETAREPYDALVISPGAVPLKPALDGIDLPGIFTLKTIPDTREIKQWIDRRAAKKAVVVGGGFIGLEMAENLKNKGLRVSVIEMQRHVMPALDEEMAAPIHAHLQSQGISLYTDSRAAGFKPRGKASIEVLLESGTAVLADIVILAIGVRPEIALAKQAGLAIGELGGIVVDDRLRTSDPNIWAVGDAVEVVDWVTGSNSLVPLAGPANRQGRMAANAIMGRSDIPGFRGVQATAVCGVLGLTIASTGASEKRLRQISINGQPLRYEKIYAHPSQHAQYYPGAKHMTIKLLFALDDGKILGAQAVGLDGVEKRIDVIAMAIQKKGTVFDLEEAELCYAPQYGAAKDPVNMVGMIAANVVRRDYAVAHWTAVEKSDALILDVRTPKEFARGHVDGAVNIPLENLRQRLAELPADRPIWTYCAVGQRSYYATRLLKQSGFGVKNLSGGYMMHRCFKKIGQQGGPKPNPFKI
jgi:NADPH-dependent 2,4-dienoyl-CoA reductase/sulfur reductase-like enzyme/rhodanese-related sulfurtransferase